MKLKKRCEKINIMMVADGALKPGAMADAKRHIANCRRCTIDLENFEVFGRFFAACVKSGVVPKDLAELPPELKQKIAELREKKRQK